VSKTTSLDYKGMTLKEYFRIPETGRLPHSRENINEEQQNTVVLVFNSLNERPKK
jgi:hypothetical protein